MGQTLPQGGFVTSSNAQTIFTKHDAVDSVFIVPRFEGAVPRKGGFRCQVTVDADDSSATTIQVGLICSFTDEAGAEQETSIVLDPPLGAAAALQGCVLDAFSFDEDRLSLQTLLVDLLERFLTVRGALRFLPYEDDGIIAEFRIGTETATTHLSPEDESLLFLPSPSSSDDEEEEDEEEGAVYDVAEGPLLEEMLALESSTERPPRTNYEELLDD